MEHKILSGMKARNKKAPGPEVVAKKVFKAATDKKDKLRYPAGKGTGMALLARKLLPTSWFNKIIFKHQNR